jgi:hypothetical protein
VELLLHLLHSQVEAEEEASLQEVVEAPPQCLCLYLWHQVVELLLHLLHSQEVEGEASLQAVGELLQCLSLLPQVVVDASLSRLPCLSPQVEVEEVPQFRSLQEQPPAMASQE